MKIDAKNFSLPIKEVLADCPDLYQYTKANKIDLGNPLALRAYNICLFKILENVIIELPESNLIPTCGLRRSIVHVILEITNLKLNDRIIEIGTGASAIIAMLFAKKGFNNIIATDINHESLIIAEKQLKINNLQDSITLMKSSGGIVNWLKDKFPVQCLVSLPPYYSSESIIIGQKRGFLGVDSELYSHGSAEDFSLQLINEWLENIVNTNYLCILWKNKLALDKGLIFLDQNKQSLEINVQIVEIKAGNRSRYLSIFSPIIII